MNLQEAKEFATEQFFDEFDSGAITVIYEGQEILAQLIRDDSESFSSNRPSTRMKLSVKRSDIEEPKARDLVIINGEEWWVHFDNKLGNITSTDNFTHRIALKTDERSRSYR